MPDTAVSKNGLSVVMHRTFDAPVSALWACWTSGKHMAQWWGPHGMRATADLDPRPGGAFSLIMHGADGTDYPLQGRYLDVVVGKLLVMQMHLDDHPASWHDYLSLQFTRAGGDEDTLPSLTVMTKVTFETAGTGTRLTVEQIYTSLAERDAFEAMGNTGGWSQSFDKLDKLLGEM